MSYRIAVAGASGYAGGELLRLLLGHPDVVDRCADRLQQCRRAARDLPAAPVPAGRPDHRADHRRRPWPATTWCFLALPHGQSHELAAQLGPDTVVIDCGADHRLTDPGRLGEVLRRRRIPGPGRTECRNCPAAGTRCGAPSGSPCPVATRRRRHLPSPRRWRPDSSSRGGGGRRLRHLGRRQVAEGQPARLRGDGVGRPPTASAACTGTPRR